jgi:hypothetical protein
MKLQEYRPRRRLRYPLERFVGADFLFGRIEGLRTERLRERRFLSCGADVGIVTGLDIENRPSISEIVLVGNRCRCSDCPTN